jgi:hypothetical protein
MQMSFQKMVGAAGLLLLLGAGCTKNADTVEGVGDADISTLGVKVCVRTGPDASGAMTLDVANATAGKENYAAWFTDSPVAKGNAGEEVCGMTPFAVAAGDKVLINGAWNDASGKRWLVENRTPNASGSNVIKAIWIDDKTYALGQECEYRSNGKMGFDLACTIR